MMVEDARFVNNESRSINQVKQEVVIVIEVLKASQVIIRKRQKN